MTVRLRESTRALAEQLSLGAVAQPPPRPRDLSVGVALHCIRHAARWLLARDRERGRGTGRVVRSHAASLFPACISIHDARRRQLLCARRNRATLSGVQITRARN